MHDNSRCWEGRSEDLHSRARLVPSLNQDNKNIFYYYCYYDYHQYHHQKKLDL